MLSFRDGLVEDGDGGTVEANEEAPETSEHRRFSLLSQLYLMGVKGFSLLRLHDLAIQDV